MTLELDIPAWRIRFPKYKDETKYSDDYLKMFWNEVSCFIPLNGNCYLKGGCLQRVAWLCLAHMIYIEDEINSGGGGSIGRSIASASESPGSVSVSFESTANTDESKSYYNSSPYGKQLLAQLKKVSKSRPIVMGGGVGLPRYRNTASFRR